MPPSGQLLAITKWPLVAFAAKAALGGCSKLLAVMPIGPSTRSCINLGRAFRRVLHQGFGDLIAPPE
jgi:hypothetical protein